MAVMMATQQAEGEERSPELVRSEWQAAMGRLDDLRRQHAALVALRPIGNRGAQSLLDLDLKIEETQARATALMRLVFESAGLPR